MLAVHGSLRLGPSCQRRSHDVALARGDPAPHDSGEGMVEPHERGEEQCVLAGFEEQLSRDAQPAPAPSPGACSPKWSQPAC